MELRPYQVRSINDIFGAIRLKQRPVLQLPTGGGKTRLASKIFQMGLAKQKRMAFCAPFLSLITQTWRAFEQAGIDPREMGIIQAQNELTDWSKPIQVCSVDTLVRRPILPQADIVMFDEVHRDSVLYGRWMEENPGAAFVGLSATPWAMHLKDHFDRLIIAATTRELIDDGYLAPYRLFAPSSPDLSGVRITAGDYNEGDLSGVMNQPKLVADVVTTWLKMAERRPTFVFAVDCAHAKSMQEQFQIAGVAAGYVDAYTPVEEREAMVAQLGTGHLEVICNIGTMTTGVDAPFVSCIVLARPTRSEMLYIQIVGRGLRIFPGKEDCIILDHSDTALTLGLPDEIEYEDFPRGDKRQGDAEKKEKLPKKCPACNYLKPVGVQECPMCGFKPEQSRSKIVCEEGELLELGYAGSVRGKKKTKEEFTRQMKQEWWAQILYEASRKGRSRGWASHIYKDKFGVWPQGLIDHPSPPSTQVLNFIRSRNIAFAKSRSRQMA